MTSNSPAARPTETANQGRRALADRPRLASACRSTSARETISAVGLSGTIAGQPKEEACAVTGIAKAAD
jgi:hypothetical protein